jgi:hypothetical protein
MELWKALDAHKGGVEAKNGGSVNQWSQICMTLMRCRIRLRIKVKSPKEGSVSASYCFEYATVLTNPRRAKTRSLTKY